MDEVSVDEASGCSTVQKGFDGVEFARICGSDFYWQEEGSSPRIQGTNREELGQSLLPLGLTEWSKEWRVRGQCVCQFTVNCIRTLYSQYSELIYWRPGCTYRRPCYAKSSSSSGRQDSSIGTVSFNTSKSSNNSSRCSEVSRQTSMRWGQSWTRWFASPYR